MASELDEARQQRDYWTAVVHYLEQKRSPAKPVRGRRVTAAAAAEEVLRAHGQPVKTPTLLREVQELGAKIANSDGLYKTLDRDKKRFRKVGRGLWALAETTDPAYAPPSTPAAAESR